jgi:hypothetical protein
MENRRNNINEEALVPFISVGDVAFRVVGKLSLTWPMSTPLFLIGRLKESINNNPRLKNDCSENNLTYNYIILYVYIPFPRCTFEPWGRSTKENYYARLQLQAQNFCLKAEGSIRRINFKYPLFLQNLSQANCFFRKNETCEAPIGFQIIHEHACNSQSTEGGRKKKHNKQIKDADS